MDASLEAGFGRRAGWARTQLARSLDLLGAFSGLRGVDFRRVERLVFVCRGNICRSAYAEARARRLGLRAISCGLDARPGAPAAPLARERAAARGVDLSGHHARRLEPALLGRGDLLVAFEPAHLRTCLGLAPTTLAGLWAKPPRPHLEDPYGLCAAYFDTCFNVIDSALLTLLPLAVGAHEP